MRPRAFLILAVLAIVPIVLSSAATPFPETLRSISHQTFKPVFQTSDFFSDQFTSLFKNGRDFLFVYKQNHELRSSLSALQREVNQLREEKRETERLRKLLPLLERAPKTVTLAQVIFRDVSLWTRGILIDRGKLHGVEKDMAVITDRGLVGRVVSVSPSTAQVLLLTDFDSRVSVLAQESRDTGLLCGEAKTLLVMKYLDLDATIKVSDIVVTSGIGGVYPKGIPVGKVEMVGRERDGLHLYAIIRPFVSFSKLEEVLCLARKTRGEELFFSS